MQLSTDNKEFQEALKLVKYTRQSIFLTGKAGTGKSTFLKYVCQNVKKKHIVLAPTGVAAINAGGCTLHSFFKLPFYPLLPDDPNFSTRNGNLQKFLKYSSAHRKLIKEVELVIIDEISMVRPDIIDFIDKVLRVYSQNMREPFGGKQVMFVGDVFQLEPVIKSDEKEIISKFYRTPYFFSANVFSQIDLVSIELKQVYRQKDKVFINVLDHIRTNSAGSYDLQLLNTRYSRDIEDDGNDMYITLATRRDTVDYINDKKLSELPGDAVKFKGEIKGDFPESSLPTQVDLVLKEGAQIIFIKNDYERRWVNGTIGTISGIDEDGGIYVITDEGSECKVMKDSWRNIRYTYNEEEKKIEEEELGVFIQYPIRLAWAITIHKSQGLTFSNVIIDFTGGVFAGGQAYVALSRCTSLDGIQLKKQITKGDIFVRPEIVEFSKRFNNQQAIDNAMKKAQADIEYNEAIKSFDNCEFDAFLEHFFIAIHSRYDIEKPLIKRFIRKKLGTITNLKQENIALKEKMYNMKDNLKKYAHEYFIMGNECIVNAHDSRAAIANYDKAIDLDPLYTDAWIRKGVTLHDDGNYHDAEKCLSEAVRLNQTSFKALYNRGKNRLKSNNEDGAATDFSRAITIKPEHPKAHELFGDALMKLGKEDEAALQWAIAERLREKKSKNK